jgi:hypothetical protein
MVGRFWKPYRLVGQGRRWQVGFDGADWWSERAGSYPIEEEHVIEEKRHR